MVSVNHKPVLVEEIVAAVPATARRVIDATIGLGGHAQAILAKASDAQLLGIDRDEASLRIAQRNLDPFASRINLMVANFREIDGAVKDIGWDLVDAILFDLGVSSWQLSEGSYGLSFQEPAPLDMRLDRTQILTAATIVNTWPEAKLVDILFDLGEEKFARRIVRAIVSGRRRIPIATTDQLSRVIEQAIPTRERFRRKTHVATNTFRALRMAVNDELGALKEALPISSRLLAKEGKLMVITFHSLEDRIVKQFLRTDPTLSILTKKPIVPKKEEIQINPRARSAKLRIAQKR